MPSRRRRKARTGRSTKRTRSSSSITVVVERRQRAGEERRVGGALVRQRARAVERDAVEAPDAVGHQLVAGEVARVERLQRVADDDLLARRADHVEQLADRHGGRPLEVRALVVAGVGDDQAVGRRHQRVEQELAVLGARVALADVRVVEHQVVAVARGLAREHAVVEAEQADDAMRDRAHRHERADGQVAGAEVRARRAALEAIGEQGADLLERELGGVAGGLADDVVEQALELGALPGVARRGRGQRVGGGGERRRPLGDRLRGVERVDGRVQAVDQLGEPAGEVDRAALDVVEREHLREQPLLVLGHRHAEQQAVEPGAPGAGRLVVELERRAVRRRGPSGCRSRGPTPRSGRGRRRRSRSGGAPARGRRGRAPARRSAARRRARAAGRRRRGPGWSGAASGRRAARAGRASARLVAGARTWPGSAARTSRCPGTSRSRRAARASGPARARAGSRRAGPRPGARGRGRSGPGRCGRRVERARSARTSACGALARRRPGCGASSVVAVAQSRRGGGGRRGPRRARAAARGVVAPRGEQPVVGQRGGRVVAAAGDRRGRRQPLPQRRRGVQQRTGGRRGRRRARAGPRGGPAGGGSGRTARAAAAGRRAPAPRAGARTRAAAARPGRARRCARAAAATARPATRRRRGCRRRRRPPRRGPSPAGAARSGRTGRRGGGRVAKRRRGGCRRGARRGSAATARRATSSTTSSSGQTARSGSHGSVRVDAGRGRHRVADQPPRRREVDVRAHAVAAAGRGAEAGRHPLRQPALHPARGDGDDLARERVGQRIGQQRAQRLDQAVGAFGSVDVQISRRNDPSRWRTPRPAGRPAPRSCPPIWAAAR